MSVQGISFYDFLGKFIPGALLLLLFSSSLPPVKLDSLEILLWIAAAYLLGILWDKIIRFFSRCLTRNDWMLARAHDKHKKFMEKIGGTYHPQDRHSIQFAYDEAYSLLMLQNMLGTVPKQEGHENFLRNIYLIIVFFLIKTIIGNGQCCCGNICNTILMLFLIALIIIVPGLWYSVQMSIYFTVWDNAYWAKYHITKKDTSVH